MKEEEAFRRAQIDPVFRVFILTEWQRSKRKARIFVIGTIVLFCAALLYTGVSSGRWTPNLFLAVLVIVALWSQSTANTTIAALRAIEEREPNQPPQRNAGSRPTSGDSAASETPSSLGPRG